MFSNLTRGRHAAPRQRQGWLARTRPACGPIPSPIVVDEAPVCPSMDLPDGHMAQRPSPIYVGTLLPKASRYRKDDEVVVTGGYSGHVGCRGIVTASYGAGRPLAVDLSVGVVYLDEEHVRLTRRPADDDTERFATVHVAVPVTTVEAQHADGTPVGYWPPSEDAPTLVMDAVEADQSDTELARFYADVMAEDAAQPETSMEEKLAYAAACAAAGNPLMPFEREIMGLPLGADDAQLTGGASR